MKRRFVERQFLIGAVLLVLVCCVIGLGSAKAQEQQPEQEVQGPVAARISMIRGDVSTQRGDSGEWVAATVNTPVMPGDTISTGDRSRAEVELDYGDVLRLNEHTVVKVADLARSRIQIQVSQGLIGFSVYQGAQASVEIDTLNMSVQPVLGEGLYRIEVNSPTEARVMVRRGEAQISNPQGSTTVTSGQVITVQGTTDDAQYRVDAPPGRDEWDAWVKERDHIIVDAESWSRTNRYYTGSNDLDRYGRWENVPDYGAVWQPYGEGPDWAPYREGRWCWEPYYGWTWTSYEPWGWAPYHYGRWFFYNDAWRWWPGPVYATYYPVWAPAYVSFFGFGDGSGWGSIGWLPIGPGDFFHPWWGGWGRSVNAVDITNVTNMTDTNNFARGMRPLIDPQRVRAGAGSNLQAALQNTRVRNSITAVDPKTFVGDRVPVHPQQVTLENLKKGQIEAGQLPVVPTRESLRPTTVAAKSSSMPSRGAAPALFFTRNQPPSGPMPFTQRQAQIQQAVRQNSTVIKEEDPNQGAGPQSAQPTGQQAVVNAGRPGVGGNAPTGQNSPFVAGRANGPASSSVERTPSATSRSTNQGNSQPRWRQFGGTPGAAPNSRTGGVAQGPLPQVSPTPATRPPNNAPAAPAWRRFSSSGPAAGGLNRTFNTQPPARQPAPPSGRTLASPPTPTNGGGAWQRIEHGAPSPPSQMQPRRGTPAQT